MPDRPVISIVTPTFNRREVLARALDSVRAQTVVDFEHIVVDDGSEDGSVEMCRRFGDPRIRVHRLDARRGANHARNEGVKLASAPVVTFLDSDDEFLPDRLERVLEVLAEESDVDLVLSSFRVRTPAAEVASVNRDQRLDGAWFEELLMWHALYLGGSSITLRRDLARRFPWAAELRRMQDREVLLHMAVRHRVGSRTPWVRILAGVDWVKHESADSISAPADGFVRALGEMMAIHPDLLARHDLAVRYQVVRHLKRQLAGRQGRLVVAALRENARAPHFRFPLPALLAAYWQGRAIRRQMIGVGMRGVAPVPGVAVGPARFVTSRAA
ncbi:MAG: glycosyltransferase family 2 protein [Planctomycetota bacterium]